MLGWKVGRELRLVSLVACALLGACALLAGCATQSPNKPSAQSQKAAPAPAPTLLRFDWGNELDTDVFAIREEFTFKGDREKVSRLEAQFHLHAQRQGDKYLLVFSDLNMKLDGRPIPANAEPAMLGPITGLVLSYEIAANGDFLSLLNLERLKSFSERSYLEQNAKLPPDQRLSRQEAEEAMQATSSREALQVAGSRTWGALVGMWAGVRLTEGQPVTSESTVTIPVIDAPLTVHSQFELVRWEECASGERAKACVRLRATSQPDSTQVAEAARKLKERRGGRAEPLTANAMQVEDRYELLTEPGTLRPRWVEWVRGADIEGSEYGTGLLESRQSTRTRMIFVYK